MFSPDAAGPVSATARNPRRRQRTASEDSIAVRHPPKRVRRSGLTLETFKPPVSTNGTGHRNHVEQASVTNGHAPEPDSQRSGSVDSTSLAIRHRGVKKAEREKRSSRNDGSIELVGAESSPIYAESDRSPLLQQIKTDNYVVSQLSTTPESLQSYHAAGKNHLIGIMVRFLTWIEKWHGEFSAPLGYALAMTQKHAIIWRYVQGTGPIDHASTLTISLLHSSNNLRHPIPLGVLVPTSAEPALLVIMPTSGKITYWESLSSAASVDINRQKQQSVQGTVSGMMSGETVVKITEAEPRGFILTLSTGRLAHLTLSDPQGKPFVGVQYLRHGGNQSGGVIGSLRSVFSNAGWKRDIAAVRAGHSWQRGQKYMVVATTKGSFQIWDLNWSGTHTLVHDIDAKEDILKALAEGAEVFHDRDEHLFEVLDFTLIQDSGSGKEVVKLNESADCKLMALTVLKGTESSRYALVGLTLANDAVKIDSIHPIFCYKTSLPPDSSFRPQLLVLDPSRTAFVLFEKSVVLVSFIEVEETPDTQLQGEAGLLSDSFQDTIDFRKNKPFRVVGCALEAYDRAHAQTSCVVMLYGFGLIRVSALPPKEGQSAMDRVAVTAQSKIEQAVFFGGSQQELLDFTPRSELTFSTEEIEKAALDVSHSILSSSSAYIPTISPSMDQQLIRRSMALADLNKHLRKHYPPLSRVTRWKLLWDAEKMASGKALWRCYTSAVSNPNKGPGYQNVFSEMVEAMHESIKNQNQPDLHQTDGVRHWFIHDIWHLEYAIPWAQQIVEMLFNESVEDRKEVDVITRATMVNEANDIQLAGLETAFHFRAANAVFYGFDNEAMMDGVLQEGYKELPEIWTSTSVIVTKVKMLTDLSRELAKSLEESLDDDTEDEVQAVSESLMVRLAADNPRQVQICCQTFIERFRWLRSRENPQERTEGQKLMLLHFAVRKALFAKLTDIGQTVKAIELAEKYHDMDALAEIIDLELSRPVDVDDMESLNDRINSNFVKFGEKWANAFFKKNLDGARAVEILNNSAAFKQHLTKFLRSDGDYARIGWIHEAMSEKSYGRAVDCLQTAEKQTTNLWSKKITLSMSKLAILASKSRENASDAIVKPAIKAIDQSVATLSIQETLKNYIKPGVSDALDAEAESDLAMQRFGSGFTSSKPTLQESLKQNFEALLSTQTLLPDDLIDTLTLMDPDPITPDPNSFTPTRFFSALRLLRLSPLTPSRKSLHEKSIWRRCLIQDDWPLINRTELKPDTAVEVETATTALFQTLAAGFRADFFTTHLPLLPSACLGAGTTIQDLRSSDRYANTPDTILASLAADLAQEDERLEVCMDEGRLEEWWSGVVDAAKATVRGDADREGEATARMAAIAQELEDRSERKDREAWPKFEDGAEEGDGVDGGGESIMDM